MTTTNGEHTPSPALMADARAFRDTVLSDGSVTRDRFLGLLREDAATQRALLAADPTDETAQSRAGHIVATLTRLGALEPSDMGPRAPGPAAARAGGVGRGKHPAWSMAGAARQGRSA